MPIYEFYCQDCHTLFNFFSKTINTTKLPTCPRCETRTLERRMSAFAFTGRAGRGEEGEDLPIEPDKMERAMQMLAGQAEHLNEDDPRQAANLMRQLTSMTGMELGAGMQEALRRMERGEDPEQIEADLGEILESEEPFQPGPAKGARGARRREPERDDRLYDL